MNITVWCARRTMVRDGMPNLHLKQWVFFVSWLGTSGRCRLDLSQIWVVFLGILLGALSETMAPMFHTRSGGGQMADIRHYSEPVPRLKPHSVAGREAILKNNWFRSDKDDKLLILDLAGPDNCTTQPKRRFGFGNFSQRISLKATYDNIQLKCPSLLHFRHGLRSHPSSCHLLHYRYT